MNKLLPCPFCGSEAEIFPRAHIENQTDNVGEWAVVCQNPDAECNARILYCNSKEEAVEQWNRRTEGR